jgi:hypothetical protein
MKYISKGEIRMFNFIQAIGLITIVIGLMFSISACSQDAQNEFKRKGVEYLDGDYAVTYYNMGKMKSWNIKDGKITSSPKGYYFFWVDGKYVQTPLNGTVIEEIE